MKIEKIIKVNGGLKLSKRTVVNLIYTGNYINLELNNSLKTFGITLQQFNVLRILRGQKGKSLNLNEIQGRMINKNSNTTRLIDKLVRKKYVKRVIDSLNRRKVIISITKSGLDFLLNLDKVIDEELEKKLVNVLTDKEKMTLNKLLEKIRLN